MYTLQIKAQCHGHVWASSKDWSTYVVRRLVCLLCGDFMYVSTDESIARITQGRMA